MVQIKRILGLTATAGGGMEIQRLDGANPPQPIGGKIVLTPPEWTRTKRLLDADARVADAAATANSEGGTDDGTEVIWKP